MSEKKELYKGASGLRWGAFILWVFAIACEIFGIFLLTTTNEEALFRLFGTNYGDSNIMMTALIVVLVVDAILCIIGALLWKKANRIKPYKGKNKVAKFFWDQFGVVMCIIAFIPLGIILLRSTDKLDAKQKKIVLAVAAVLFAGSVSASIDYNPVEPGDSQNLETLIERHYSEDEITRDDNGNIVVYWTQYGKSFHLDENCHHIADSTTKTSGTIEEAIEAGKTDPCDHCLSEIKELNKEDIEGIVDDSEHEVTDGEKSTEESEVTEEEDAPVEEAESDAAA